MERRMGTGRRRSGRRREGADNLEEKGCTEGEPEG